MLNLNSNSVLDRNLLKFLEKHPSLSHSLFVGGSSDIREVTTLIEPVLKTQTRCQKTSLFIHGVFLNNVAFLVTNLPSEGRDLFATSASTSWLIGRAIAPDIRVNESTVSRCHAVIGHHNCDSFFVTDIGSRNGTSVNGQRLEPQQRCILSDGDIIRFGHLEVEFFNTLKHEQEEPHLCDITYS